jgi:hypothetical protein
MARRMTKKLTWTDLTKKMKGEARDYDMSQSFYEGDYIAHGSFGLGYIQSTFGNKIEVLFEDKVRLLVQRVVF